LGSKPLSATCLNLFLKIAHSSSRTRQKTRYQPPLPNLFTTILNKCYNNWEYPLAPTGQKHYAGDWRSYYDHASGTQGVWTGTILLGDAWGQTETHATESGFTYNLPSEWGYIFVQGWGFAYLYYYVGYWDIVCYGGAADVKGDVWFGYSTDGSWTWSHVDALSPHIHGESGNWPWNCEKTDSYTIDKAASKTFRVYFENGKKYNIGMRLKSSIAGAGIVEAEGDYGEPVLKTHFLQWYWGQARTDPTGGGTGGLGLSEEYLQEPVPARIEIQDYSDFEIDSKVKDAIDQAARIRCDPSLTEEQKSKALRRVYDGIVAEMLPDAKDQEVWNSIFWDPTLPLEEKVEILKRLFPDASI